MFIQASDGTAINTKYSSSVEVKANLEGGYALVSYSAFGKESVLCKGSWNYCNEKLERFMHLTNSGNSFRFVDECLTEESAEETTPATTENLRGGGIQDLSVRVENGAAILTFKQASQ